MKIHVVGGFLGSGKTTAISQAARLLERYLLDEEMPYWEDRNVGQRAAGGKCGGFGKADTDRVG